MIVKPSIAFEDMRKSAGGVTASKNKARLYIKNRITPRNPKTEKQMQVRSDLTTNSRAWANLTQAQRDAWDEEAKTAYGRRELGEAAKISGFSLFMRCNQNLATIAGTEIKVPGTTPDFPVYQMWSFGASVASNGQIRVGASLDATYEELPANIVIRATAPFGPGRASNITGLRIIKAGAWQDDVDANAETESYNLDLSTEYTNTLGAGVKVGDKIQFEMYFIDPTSGYASLKQTAVVTIKSFGARETGSETPSSDVSVYTESTSAPASSEPSTQKVKTDDDGDYITETVVNKKITRRPAK